MHLDLRVLAVIVDGEVQGKKKIFTMLNAEAQRRAVYTPLDELLSSPDTVTDKITHIPITQEIDPEMSIAEFLTLPDNEKEEVLSAILNWISHGEAD